MAASKHAIVQEAQRQLDSYFSAQWEKSYVQLAPLVEESIGSSTDILGKEYHLSCWAQSHEDGSLGVIAEARRFRFLGWSQVHARGFFAFQEGRKVEMVKEDLWSHGY